jgi:hypothetical protein
MLFYDSSVLVRHARCEGLVFLLALFLAGCGGGEEPRGADEPLCSGRGLVQHPCVDARLEVDYRLRVSTHCGVRTAYLDGRWWRIDPPQPEGRNWLAGTARLLSSDELVFETDDGRRYAFAPAPPGFVPPPCY